MPINNVEVFSAFMFLFVVKKEKKRNFTEMLIKAKVSIQSYSFFSSIALDLYLPTV